jgi:hypothetical protein
MRCKFKLISITRAEGTVTKLGEDGYPVANDKGQRITEPGEVWSIKMSPVYANDNPKHENSVFWAYSPGGSFELQTVNKAAVAKLELGAEYYLDITRAG